MLAKSPVNYLFLLALPACLNGCSSRSSSRSQPESGTDTRNVVGLSNTVTVVGATTRFYCNLTGSANISNMSWSRLQPSPAKLFILAKGVKVAKHYTNKMSVELYDSNETYVLILHDTTLVDAGYVYRCEMLSEDSKFGAELIVIESEPVCTQTPQRSKNSSVVQVSVSVACASPCSPELQCTLDLTDLQRNVTNYAYTNTTNVTQYFLSANVETSDDVDGNISCNVLFSTSLNVNATNKPSYRCRWRPPDVSTAVGWLSTKFVLVVSSSVLLVVVLSIAVICYCVRRGSPPVGCHKTDTDSTHTNQRYDDTKPQYNQGAGVYDEIAPVPLPRSSNLPVISHSDRQACSRPAEPSEHLVYAELQPKRTPNKNAATGNRKAKKSPPVAATRDQTYAAIDHNRRAY